MGVSKNSGTPKWMVKIMENPIKIDDLGVPLFVETPKYWQHQHGIESQTGRFGRMSLLIFLRFRVIF